MDRRTALLFTIASLAAGCGGGGGASTAPAGQTATSPPVSAGPAPAPPALSSNVIAWGDSLTPAFALNLQVIEPNRTVIEQGFNGQTSSVIETAQLADMDHRDWINIFWYGHNDFREAPDSAPATVAGKLAASIAHLVPGNTHFIVLSVVNDADFAPRGTATYAAIIALNAQLAALYPENYVDVRSWLVAHYDPTLPQDVTDFANDVPPTSLRYDSIHLRNEGSVLVAQRVAAFIDAKGW